MFKSLVSSGLFLGLGVLVCTPLWGGGVTPCVNGDTSGYLCVTPPSSISVAEGPEVISNFSFLATNYTGHDLVVDIVGWAITPLGPDFSDTVVKTGVPASFLNPLPNGDTDTFTWSMIMPNPPGCDPLCDYGVNQVTFSINTDYLNPPGPGVPVLGLSTVDGSTNTYGYITVYDTPEPASALMLVPALVLLGLRKCRVRPATSAKNS